MNIFKKAKKKEKDQHSEGQSPESSPDHRPHDITTDVVPMLPDKTYSDEKLPFGAPVPRKKAGPGRKPGGTS